MSLLSAKNLSLTLQGNPVLRDVSLDIGEHDFITILGPNGAGKSLLLKCLIGSQKPDSGSIHKAPACRIGYVPQHFRADSSVPITAEAFLQLRRPSLIDSEVIAQTRIEPFMSRPLSALSGGEMQRVLLARALLGNPTLLLLDEPAQHLDLAGQLSFYRLLEEIYESRQLSILMVSHDLHLVIASTKQVICLYHHICCSGTPQAVAKDPEFIHLFGADMAQMLAIYHHSHDHIHDATCNHESGHSHA